MTRISLKLAVLALLTTAYALAARGPAMGTSAEATSLRLCPCDWYGNPLYYVCDPPQRCGGDVDQTCACVD